MQRLLSKNEKEQTDEGQQIDYTKVQGFDILDKLDEKKTYDSYNEKYYGTLDNLQFLSISIPPENKLFYHFTENPNASLTTTTGQLYRTYLDMVDEEKLISEIIKSAEEEINSIVKDVDGVDAGIIEKIKPQIEEMEQSLRKFLVEQKTENFKLIKEIATLNKEKDNLIADIDSCVLRLENLERHVGRKKGIKQITVDKFDSANTNQINANDSIKNQAAFSNTNVVLANTFNSSSTENNPKYFGDTISVVQNK